ncbi:FAD-dependent monooxygenase [Paenibacillus aurantiacus]|uniref:FAD-dependent monooxygenase n=1 Tax=Paenibacillus aurantiacus TaxID=1936118 RepID=A0ABV5KSV1_9BACL
MTKGRKILISGSSIAGPALAYWLHRYGFEVTIVERASGLRKGGFGVDIRGAAITVLERMGILEQVRAADTRMTGVYFVDERGKTRGKISEAGMGNEQGVDIEVMRDDLADMLHNLTKDTIRYVWGDSITDMQETKEGVRVQFAHHAPQTFDAVIGADGLHSHVRKLTFGDESQFKRSLGCYISVFTTSNYLNLDYCQQLYTMPGKTVGMYSARHNAEAKGMFVFKSAPLQYDRHDPDSQKRLVAEAFGSTTGWETERLLQSMKTSDDFYFDEICQIHMPAWSKGRVALVGDAAYGPSPLSGQGTSLALVGAYILAGELKSALGDYPKAFANYEQAMRPYVEKNQKIGLTAAASMVASSKFKITLQDWMFRIPFLMTTMFKMITKMIEKAANGVDLKDYPKSV